MKTLIKFPFVLICIIFFTCTEESFLEHPQPISFDSNIEDENARKAPVFDDLVFQESGFSSFVFYNNITGPDGIHLLNNNKLLVTKEYGGDVGIYLAKRGAEYDLKDAFSTLNLPFDSPDDMLADEAGYVYVADGQARIVFRLNSNGGSPMPFVTQATTGSVAFNPFGLTIAPPGFDGPNVDPGDLIVCDNGFYLPPEDPPVVQELQALWAVNRYTGTAKAIVQGDNLEGGPIRAGFNSEGTLFVTLNLGPGEPNKMVSIDANGDITSIKDIVDAPFFAIHPLTDDIYYKIFDLTDEPETGDGIGHIYRMSKDGTGSTLFASNVGTRRAGTQDMIFNRQGSTLFVSHRNEKMVVTIYSNKHNW